MAIDEIETNEANRNVDEKNEAPMKITHDEAAGDRAEHRSDQTGDGDEAHRTNEFGLRERAHHRQAADGNHHGAAAALQNAAGNQLVDVGGESAEQGAEREDADGGRKDAARAVAIGHPAADGNEDGEAECVTREHGLHCERRDVKSGGDGGDRRVENSRVQGLHEEGNGNEPREESAAGLG
jgi:hypothetical protein